MNYWIGFTFGFLAATTFWILPTFFEKDDYSIVFTGSESINVWERNFIAIGDAEYYHAAKCPYRINTLSLKKNGEHIRFIALCGEIIKFEEVKY